MPDTVSDIFDNLERGPEPAPQTAIPSQVSQIFDHLEYTARPDFDPRHSRQAEALREARDYQRTRNEGFQHTLFRRLPGAGAGQAIAENQALSDAQERYGRGEATQADIGVIARMERLGEIERQRSFGEQVGEIGLGVPAQAAEIMGAGGVARALAPSAGIVGGLARVGAFTAALPSTYPEAVERGLPQALTLSAIRNGIFMAAGNAAAGGVSGYLRNLGTGMGASEAMKEAEGLLGISTGHGAVGALLEGQQGEALRQVATDAISIGTLQLMHGASPEEVSRTLQSRIQEADIAHQPPTGPEPGIDRSHLLPEAPPAPSEPPAGQTAPAAPPEELIHPIQAAANRLQEAETAVTRAETAEAIQTRDRARQSLLDAMQTARQANVPPRQPVAAVEGPEAPETKLYHIADYKNPANSAMAAGSMLERRGAPVEHWLWDGPESMENAHANLPRRGVMFQYDREGYVATHGADALEPRGTGTSYGRGRVPMRYDPSLERIVYNGERSDPAFARLRENVEAANGERADEALMREYGHAGALPPIDLRTPGERSEPSLADRLRATGRQTAPTPETQPAQAPRLRPRPPREAVGELRDVLFGATREGSANMMEQARLGMERQGITAGVQRKLTKFFNDLQANFPGSARELARRLQEHPHRAAEILEALSPAREEAIDAATESISGGEGIPASLRRGVGSRLPESPGGAGAQPAGEGGGGGKRAEAPAGPAKAAGPAPAGGGAGPSAAADLAAARDQLINEHIPATIQDLAAQIHAAGDSAHWADMQRALETVFGKEAADAIAERLGKQVVVSKANEGLRGTQRVARTDIDYEPLVDHMIEEARKHETLKAAAAGIPASESTEAFRAGETLGQTEGEAAETLTPEQRRAFDEQLAAWDAELDRLYPEPKPPESLPEPAGPGFGESAGGKGLTGVDKSIYDITSAFLKEEHGYLDPQKLKEFAQDQYERMKTRLRLLGEGFRKLAGEKVPAMLRLHEPSADAAASFDTAGERARMAAPYFTDQMMGGKGHTEAERKFIGATFNEWRLQNMRRAYRTEAARLLAQGDTKGFQEMMAKSAAVKSFLGTPDYAANQADFQRDLNSAPFRQFLARWAAKGGFAEVMERNYKAAQGLDEQSTIDSLTQIPGFPINLLGLDNAPGGPQSARGNLANTRARKLAFSNEATGTASAYETDIGKIIENSLVRGESLAAKAKWLRTMVDGEIAQWGRPDQRLEGYTQIPNVKPPRGTQMARPEETSLYVRNEIEPETRQLLQVDKPWGRIPGTQILTGVNLMGLTEAAYHTLNNMTMGFKAAMYPSNFARNAWAVMRGDPRVMQTILELSRQGVGFRESQGGLFGGGKYDPTGYASRFLEGVQRTMALTMNDAFDSLARRGLVEPTEANRRNFISQLGNYSKRTQNSVVAFLRDTGLGPTSTAGTNFMAQSLRMLALSPGVRATNPAAAVKMRAEILARGMGVLATVGVSNYLLWGNLLGDDKTPLGAVKIGEQNGKTQYVDLFGMTPWGRGARETGAASLLESARAGSRPGPSVDAALDRVVGSLARPFLGAPVQFGAEALTGRNPATGRQLAPLAAQGDSQHWENLKAALWNLNPAVATLSGRNMPGNRRAETDWSSLLGPFGPRLSSRPPGSERRRFISVPARR